MMMEKIWCLFSIDNNYDQPDNNLLMWWANKPSIETVGRAIAGSFPANSDDVTLGIVKIWGGEEHDVSNTSYRLVQVLEGCMPPVRK